ncbi:MAG: hypothetical protein LCH81_18275 [Bacteroidetes bacterium]|nr:hypothetical protein [Bacteroidota bacterium]
MLQTPTLFPNFAPADRGVYLLLQAFFMVLAIFRNNRVSTAIFLALYVVLTRATALFGWVHVMPWPAANGSLLYKSWFGWTENAPFYSALAAAVLVYLQALMVNWLVDEFRLMSDRNWFPGLFYVLVTSILPEFLFISAPLVAATFVPISLRKVFKSYKSMQATPLVFDAALWMSVAALFYPPALMLLLAAYSGIMVMRSFQVREQLVFFTGAFTPLFLAWLWYLWADQGSEFRAIQFGGIFQLYRFNVTIDHKMLLKTALLVILFFVFIFGLGQYFQRKLIQTQKAITTLYWVLFTGGLLVLFRADWHWEHFLLPAAAASIFLAFSFHGIRRKLIAEVLHLALLAALFFIQIFP